MSAQATHGEWQSGLGRTSIPFAHAESHTQNLHAIKVFILVYIRKDVREAGNRHGNRRKSNYFMNERRKYRFILFV